MTKRVNSTDITFNSSDLRRLSRRELLLLMLKQAEETENLKKDYSEMQLAHRDEIAKEKQHYDSFGINSVI